MRTVKQFLHKVFPGLASQLERNERYLAQSVDAADLERRQHELENGDLQRAPFLPRATVRGATAWRPMW